MFKRLMVMAALLGFGGSALAVELTEGQRVQTVYNGQTVIITALPKFTSAPGEDKVTFLKRVGRYMQDYSFHNKVETCASIWENPADTQWALQLTTTNSHIECLIIQENPTGDSTWVQDAATIHSHPLIHEFKLSEVDAQLSGDAPVGKRKELFNAEFSPMDKAAGPGYLIANRELQYQKDNGAVYTNFGAIAE
jgi:hypothetical protein